MHIFPKHPETCRLIPSFTPLYIPDLPPISIKKFQKMLDFPNAGLTGAVSFRSAGNAGFGRRRLYKSHARYPYGSRGGVQPRSQMSNGTSSSGVMSLNPLSSSGDANDGCDAVSGSEVEASLPSAVEEDSMTSPRNDASFSLRLFASSASFARQ